MKIRYLILTLFLPLLFQACSNQDDEPDGGARENHVIEFDSPFISTMSRAEKADINFDKFRIFGFVRRPDSYIYEGNIVSRQDNGSWTCDTKEYWYPGKIYYFTGLVPAESAGVQFAPIKKGSAATIAGGGSITYDIRQTLGKEDLLYAFNSIKTPSQLPAYIPPVEMEFQHILSQITFTFHNELGNPHYFINIPNIMLAGICSKASINFTQAHALWQRVGEDAAWIGTESMILAVHTGKPQTSVPLYILPVNISGSEIVVYTQVFYTDTPFGQVGHKVTEIETIHVPFPKIDLKPGRAYNFVCHLSNSNVEGDGGTLSPITFSVEEGNWRYDYYIDAP